jgi:hypothetical protein
MGQELFTELQEALVYVFWPIVVWFTVMVVTGGVFGSLISFAMDIFSTREQ